MCCIDVVKTIMYVVCRKHACRLLGIARPEVDLGQLEALLASPDAIMEPDVWDCVKQYVEGGGQPHAVVDMLSSNYRGAQCWALPGHALSTHGQLLGLNSLAASCPPCCAVNESCMPAARPVSC